MAGHYLPTFLCFFVPKPQKQGKNLRNHAIFWPGQARRSTIYSRAWGRKPHNKTIDPKAGCIRQWMFKETGAAVQEDGVRGLGERPSVPASGFWYAGARWRHLDNWIARTGNDRMILPPWTLHSIGWPGREAGIWEDMREDGGPRLVLITNTTCRASQEQKSSKTLPWTRHKMASWFFPICLVFFADLPSKYAKKPPKHAILWRGQTSPAALSSWVWGVRPHVKPNIPSRMHTAADVHRIHRYLPRGRARKGAGEHVARASFLLAGREVIKIYFWKGGLFWRFRELVSGGVFSQRKNVSRNSSFLSKTPFQKCRYRWKAEETEVMKNIFLKCLSIFRFSYRS